jgi:serine/threonine-protein kinase
MGEVWKARDTELDRDVALKVSKAEFTARFKQEARVMAAFSHPNAGAYLLQQHDVARSDRASGSGEHLPGERRRQRR